MDVSAFILFKVLKKLIKTREELPRPSLISRRELITGQNLNLGLHHGGHQLLPERYGQLLGLDRLLHNGGHRVGIAEGTGLTSSTGSSTKILNIILNLHSFYLNNYWKFSRINFFNLNILLKLKQVLQNNKTAIISRTGD